jgi:hypothetical protein
MRDRRRQPVVLTERGERVVGVLYGCAIAIGTTTVILGAMGLAGWIEGLN